MVFRVDGKLLPVGDAGDVIAILLDSHAFSLWDSSSRVRICRQFG